MLRKKLKPEHLHFHDNSTKWTLRGATAYFEFKNELSEEILTMSSPKTILQIWRKECFDCFGVISLSLQWLAEGSRRDGH